MASPPPSDVARPIDFTRIAQRCRLHGCPLCAHVLDTAPIRSSSTVTPVAPVDSMVTTEVSMMASETSATALRTAAEPIVCDICAQSVPPTSFMTCFGCRHQLCCACLLRAISVRGFGGMSALQTSNIGCVFCRQPFTAIELYYLSLVYESHADVLPFRLFHEQESMDSPLAQLFGRRPWYAGEFPRDRRTPFFRPRALPWREEQIRSAETHMTRPMGRLMNRQQQVPGQHGGVYRAMSIMPPNIDNPAVGGTMNNPIRDRAVRQRRLSEFMANRRRRDSSASPNVMTPIAEATHVPPPPSSPSTSSTPIVEEPADDDNTLDAQPSFSEQLATAAIRLTMMSLLSRISPEEATSSSENVPATTVENVSSDVSPTPTTPSAQVTTSSTSRDSAGTSSSADRRRSTSPRSQSEEQPQDPRPGDERDY